MVRMSRYKVDQGALRLAAADSVGIEHGMTGREVCEALGWCHICGATDECEHRP